MSTESVKVPARVAAALKKQIEAAAALRENQLQLALKRTELAEVERRLTLLQRAASPMALSAWCVDLTEDGSGTVATIEVPGEPQQVLLAPGCRAPDAGDGVLALRELMSPEQAFFNAAILPGWQKFRPTYRTGTIVSVDTEADTATVELEAALSSAQGLNVNQAVTLVDIPVEYMTCNASVFEPEDRCVVQFVGQNWAAPKVIGFAQWPKACGKWECVYASGVFYGYRLPDIDPNIDEALIAIARIIDNKDIFSFQSRIDGGAWLTMDYLHPIQYMDGKRYLRVGFYYPKLYPIYELEEGKDPVIVGYYRVDVYPGFSFFEGGGTIKPVIECIPLRVVGENAFGFPEYGVVNQVFEFRILDANGKSIFYSKVLNDALWFQGVRGKSSLPINLQEDSIPVVSFQSPDP